MTNCTGKRCPFQVRKINPITCEAYKDCQWATRPMTNADRIRAMTDKELARFFDMIMEGCHCCPASQHGCGYDCHVAWLDWLKQEVSDEL